MNSIRAVLPVAIVLVGLITQNLQASEKPTTPRGWDMEKAAQYLDDRMDIRFAKATQLRTDQGTTACVSCHTVIPYALARPALRKAMGVSKPTPQEAKLLDETARRAVTCGSHQHAYDKKEKECRGSEAVLNALILANQDAVEQRQQQSEPARKAFRELWETQRPDGAWDWQDAGLEPDESADGVFYGAALAAIAVGTAPKAANDKDEYAAGNVSRLRAYLKEKSAEQSLFNQVWMLLASTRLPGLLTSTQRDALMAEMQKRQNGDGGWSLYQLGPWRWSKTTPPFGPGGTVDVELLTRSDGYATGLIVYALRQAGLPSGHPVLQRARDWLIANQLECRIDQHDWKCWRAYSLNHDHEHGGAHGELWRRMFMSDAATGFAVLALLALE